MSTESLVDALEREHQQIDHAIDDFLSEGGDATALLGAITALRRHIYLEEEYLFPALPDPALAAPVFVMLREHAQMWRLLDALDTAHPRRPVRSGPAVQTTINPVAAPQPEGRTHPLHRGRHHHPDRAHRPHPWPHPLDPRSTPRLGLHQDTEHQRRQALERVNPLHRTDPAATANGT